MENEISFGFDTAAVSGIAVRQANTDCYQHFPFTALMDPRRDPRDFGCSQPPCRLPKQKTHQGHKKQINKKNKNY